MSRAAHFAQRWAFTLARAAEALTVGVVSKPRRRLIDVVCAHYGYAPGRLRGRLPVVPVAGVVDEATPVQLRTPEAVDGNVTTLELLVLARLVAARRPRRLFEIGTFDGRTTLNLAANAGTGSHTWTLDLPPAAVDATALPLAPHDRAYVEKPVAGARFAGSDVADRITQLWGDSARVETPDLDGTMDFVFVDGAHSREYVLSDAAFARRLLGPRGGVVAFHDYGTWDGVTEAVDALAAGDPAWRGLRAVAGTSLAIADLSR